MGTYLWGIARFSSKPVTYSWMLLGLRQVLNMAVTFRLVERLVVSFFLNCNEGEVDGLKDSDMDTQKNNPKLGFLMSNDVSQQRTLFPWSANDTVSLVWQKHTRNESQQNSNTKQPFFRAHLLQNRNCQMPDTAWPSQGQSKMVGKNKDASHCFSKKRPPRKGRRQRRPEEIYVAIPAGVRQAIRTTTKAQATSSARRRSTAPPATHQHAGFLPQSGPACAASSAFILYI
jgi:hypothetical protein